MEKKRRKEDKNIPNTEFFSYISQNMMKEEWGFRNAISL